MKSGDQLPSAREFKTILFSVGNKKLLQTLIKAQLSQISQSINQKLLYSVGEECMCISSANVKHDPGFNQCEANTIMLSFYIVLRSSGYSDHVYIQAAAISHHVPDIICIKKKKQLIFCRGK